MRSLAQIPWLAAGLAALLVISGCNLLSPTPVAWSLTGSPAPPLTPAGTPGGSDTPAPVPGLSRPTGTPFRGTPTGSARRTPGATLLSESPRLVFARSGGQELVTWDIHQAASKTIPLSNPIFLASDLHTGASPTGAWLALRTQASDG